MSNSNNIKGNTHSYWSDKATLALAGKTVKEVRYLTEQEMNDMMWYRKAPVIFFEDGSYVFPSADDEGNDAGALFTSDEKCSIIPTI